MPPPGLLRLFRYSCVGARVCGHDPGSGDDPDGLRQHLLDGVQRGFLRGGRPRHDFERAEAEEDGG